MKPTVRTLAAILLLALASCRQAPLDEVQPALWEVRGPQGQHGWLFGTIHALPEAVDWRSPAIDGALTRSDALVLEIADAASVPAIFGRLARSPGLPPIEQRLPPAQRAQFERLMRELKLSGAQFAGVETWAAAMMLAQSAQGDADSVHGLETELRRAASDKPVRELEGGEAQLGMFDALPESEQRDLLAAVVEEASRPEAEDRLYLAWSRGDMAMLESEARTGMLADPELRFALLENRNRAWAGSIAAMLAKGMHPFVAAGAAHMAGPDGLPALLAAQGFKVIRIQ